MNEIFGYCGWDFGGALNNKFQKWKTSHGMISPPMDMKKFL